MVSNVVLVIPGLPLVIVITEYVQNRSYLTIALVIALTSWAASARVLRAQTLSLRERHWRIIGVEILPNLAPIVAAQLVTSVIFAILTEAGLSFLGLGSISDVTLGTMLYLARNGQAMIMGA